MNRARIVSIALTLAVAGTGVSAVSGRVSPPPTRPFANRCMALRSVATGRLVAPSGATGFAASATKVSKAAPFFLKPTGIGTYMLYDQRAELLSAGAGGQVIAEKVAGRKSEFAVKPTVGAYSLRATASRRWLTIGHAGALELAPVASTSSRFALITRSGCRRFPEAQVGATVHRPSTNIKHGKIFGFIDDHVHVTGNLRAGGDVISGEPYDRFGIAAALGRDVKIHGVDGKLDLTGNLLRTGVPVGTHDTHGWPSFTGWPTYNSMTHQQAYYVWLERAWRAGMRMMVAQTADDEPICRIEPRRTAKTCSETASVQRQIEVLKGLQRYVDAQSGGPGRGWFRLVYSPAQARQVMKAGKLAVLIGIESSDLFGCSELRGKAQCTRGAIDRGLAKYKRLGVRGMFVAHWINNAFAGSAFEGGAKGVFINILNRFQTGSYFKTGKCPGADTGAQVQTLSPGLLKALAAFFPAAKSVAKHPMPKYPAEPRCNPRGLTSLGRYLVKRLMANHMLIEVDHLSEKARDEVISMAEKAHYPLISSHNGTGGEWSPAELIRLYKLGGFAAVTPDVAPLLAKKILAMTRHDHQRFVGIGLGTDTNGFSSLPGPRNHASRHPLHYPFKSYDGSTSFVRERTGTRTFDLNKDGVAHYGLIADLIADVERSKNGRRALPYLFNSAEAYIETWQRAYAHR